MKIALIHNPDAFLGEGNGSELRQVFLRAGHEVAYVNMREPNWQRVVSSDIERAIIVGGDGTVQLVAPYLKGTPFSILPFGTANNIAQCLHQASNAELLASQLDQAEVRQLDLGKVTHGSESKPFLEATGYGCFCGTDPRDARLAEKKMQMEQAESRTERFAQSLEQLQAISRAYKGTALELKADDTVISDHFILIAVMNMQLIGPRLHLAPQADPGDGYLDLVFVREEDRNNLCRWLECQLPGQKQAAHLERKRCRRVEARAGIVAPIHIDSQLIQSPKFPLFIELEAAALKYTVLPG